MTWQKEKGERNWRRIKEWQKGMWFPRGRQCRGEIEDIGNNQTLRCTHINTHTHRSTNRWEAVKESADPCSLSGKAKTEHWFCKIHKWKIHGSKELLALRQRQGTSGHVLVSQMTPSLGLSLGGSGQCWICWTRAKANLTNRKAAWENRKEEI